MHSFSPKQALRMSLDIIGWPFKHFNGSSLAQVCVCLLKLVSDTREEVAEGEVENKRRNLPGSLDQRLVLFTLQDLQVHDNYLDKKKKSFAICYRWGEECKTRLVS